MVKPPTLPRMLAHLLQLPTTSEEAETKIEYIKEAALQIKCLSIDELAQNFKNETDGFVSNYLCVLVKFFDDQSSDVRSLSTQEYDILIKRFYERTPSGTLRLIVSQFRKFADTGRRFRDLLVRISYMQQRLDFTSRRQSAVCETILKGIADKLSDKSTIVHETIEKLFPTIIQKLVIGDSMLKTVFHSSINQLFSDNVSAFRSSAVVASHICQVAPEFTEEGLQLANEYLLNSIRNSEKPSLSVYYFYQNIANKVRAGRCIEELKKATSLLLISASVFTPEVVYAVLAALAEVITNLPSALEEFDPSTLEFCRPQEIESLEDSFIDPLIMSTLYDMNKKPAMNMSLPSYESIVVGGASNLKQYVAGFLIDKFLHFEFADTSDGYTIESNIRSSLQSVALTTLLVIAAREPLSHLEVHNGNITFSMMDVPKLAFSPDVPVSQKAISMIPLLLEHGDKESKLDAVIQKIVSLGMQRSEIISLFDAFNHSNIHFLQESHFKRMLELALCCAETGSNNHKVSGVQFVAAALTLNGTSQILGMERLESFVKLYLTTLKTNTKLVRNSNMIDGLLRIYSIDLKPDDDKQWIGLQKVLNCPVSLPAKKDSKSKKEKVHELCQFLSIEQSRDFLNCLTVPLNICNRLIDITKYATHEFEVLDYVDGLEGYEMKREDVLGILNMTAKLYGRRMAKLVKMRRLPACAEIAEKVFLLGLESSDLFIAAYDSRAKIALSRNSEYGYEKKEAFISLFADLSGASNNYKGTLKSSADEKLFEYLDLVNSLISTALEFTRLESFQYFYELTEWIRIVYPIKPEAALDLLHQLLKCTFSTNSVSGFDSGFDDCYKILTDFSPNIVEIVNKLNSDDKLHQQLLNSKKGYLNREQPDNRLHKTKIDSMLPHIEPLLHQAIKIFSSCSIDGKKKILMLMVELMLNGSDYDLVDGSNIIRKEMLEYWAKPKKAGACELLPSIAQFIVVHAKAQKRPDEELERHKITLLETSSNLTDEQYSFVVEALVILCLNLSPLFESDFSKLLTKLFPKMLDSSPYAAIDLLNVILCTKDSEEKEKYEQCLVPCFLTWLLTEPTNRFDRMQLFFPLAIISPKLLVDFVDEKLKCAVSSRRSRSANVDSLLLFVSSHLEYKTIDSNEMERFKRLSSAIFSIVNDSTNAIYKNSDDVRRAIITILSSKNPELIDKASSSKLLRELDGSDKNALCTIENNHDMKIEAQDNNEKNGGATHKFLDSLIMEILSNPSCSRSVRVLLKQRFEDIWYVLEVIVKRTPELFWRALISEFRYRILELKLVNPSESSELLEKLQMLVDRSIEKTKEGTSDFAIFVNLVAFVKDIEIQFSEVDLETFNSYITYCENKVVGNTKVHWNAAKVLVTMYNDKFVQELIERHPIETLPSVLELIKSWICKNASIDIYEEVASKFTFVGLNNADVKFPSGYDEKKRNLKDLLCYCYGVSFSASILLDHCESDLLTAALLRHPVVYEMFMISQEAIKQGWIPVINVNTNGSINVHLPKVHILCNKSTLVELQMKISKVGWLNKAQFDNLCVSLLGVLSSTPTGPELSMRPAEEVDEIIDSSDMAVQMLTSILLMSVKFPSQGSPMSWYVTKYREQLDPFFSTREFNQFSSLKSLYRGTPKTPVAENVERFNTNGWTSLTDKFGPNQLPVVSLLTLCGLLDKDNRSPKYVKGVMPSISQFLFETASDLDTVSNVRSLLHCYTHWLSQGVDLLPPTLLNSVVKSLAYLSDFFDDISTYKFLLEQSKIIFDGEYNKGMSEEGLVVYSILKSISIIGIENFHDIQKQMIVYIDQGLRNNSNSAVYTLAGLLYLLESTEMSTVPQVAEYVTRFLLDNFDTFFSKYAYRPANSSRFALSATIRILQDPFSTKYKAVLFEKVFDAFISCESNTDIDVLTEGIEMLLCASIESVEKYYALIRAYFSKKELFIRPANLVCWIRVLSVMIYRYSASNDELHHAKLRIFPIILIKIFEIVKKEDFEWILRALPQLVEKCVGFEASFQFIIPTRFRVSAFEPYQLNNYYSLLKERMTQIDSSPELAEKWITMKPLICRQILDMEHSEDVKQKFLEICNSSTHEAEKSIQEVE